MWQIFNREKGYQRTCSFLVYCLPTPQILPNFTHVSLTWTLLDPSVIALKSAPCRSVKNGRRWFHRTVGKVHLKRYYEFYLFICILPSETLYKCSQSPHWPPPDIFCLAVTKYYHFQFPARGLTFAFTPLLLCRLAMSDHEGVYEGSKREPRLPPNRIRCPFDIGFYGRMTENVVMCSGKLPILQCKIAYFENV